MRTIFVLSKAVSDVAGRENLKTMTIPVTNHNTYKGQKENWTEQITGFFVTTKEMVLVHKSYHKISSFQVGVTTCAYSEGFSDSMLSVMTYEEAKKHRLLYDYTNANKPSNEDQYVYIFTVPKGTYMEEYCNEVRFKMSEKISVNLVGMVGSVKIASNELFPYETRCYGGKAVSVWTKKF